MPEIKGDPPRSRVSGAVATLTRPSVIHRKMAAVLVVDVAGYTRLMELDETSIHAEFMNIMSEIVAPLVAEYGGRVVKGTGDGFIASFDGAASGVTCAILLQGRLAAQAALYPPERRILFRMGLNYCDTIVEANDIYGEGVNLAARLQAYAEPGDIVLEGSMASMVEAELADQTTFDLGELYLKNISRRVKATGVRIGTLRTLPPRLRPLGSDTKPSIAVLPFGREDADGLLAKGVVSEIIHALAGLKQLFVISWTSTLHYEGKSVDPKEVGRELGVDYLLTGILKRRGDCVLISTELIDTTTGRLIRSDRFEEDSRNLVELPSRISLAAMKTVAPEVMEWELRRGLRKHPESQTAYDLVLQALQYLYRMDYESHSRARSLLLSAIALDADYALPYSYAAYWYIFRVGEGWTADPDDDSAEAARLAKAAIDRDGNDALALAIFGHVQAFLLRNFDAADVILNRAIDVGPSCALAWAMSSVTRGYLGDGRGAVERAEQGIRLSPIDAHIFWNEGMLAQAHYINGDYASATAWARKSASRRSTAMFNLRVLAASLVALGRSEDARAVAEEILKYQPQFRLCDYQLRCPFTGTILRTWIERLAMAGLPE
jgi:adenylate cyclase